MVAAADKVDDLDLVAVLDPDLGQRRARHDLAVTLDRDLFRLQPQFRRETGEAEPGRDAPALAIDRDSNRSASMPHVNSVRAEPVEAPSSSEERRVGKEGVSNFMSRWSPNH